MVQGCEDNNISYLQWHRICNISPFIIVLVPQLKCGHILMLLIVLPSLGDCNVNVRYPSHPHYQNIFLCPTSCEWYHTYPPWWVDLHLRFVLMATPSPILKCYTIPTLVNWDHSSLEIVANANLKSGQAPTSYYLEICTSSLGDPWSY